MAKTKYIENIQSCGNLDTDITQDIALKQSNQVETIVLLDKDNKSNEFIADDVNITYMRKLQEGEREEYEDKNGNPGYKQTYAFGLEEFSGQVSSVCLANKNFIDPRFSNAYSLTSGSDIYGTNQTFSFSASDILTQYSRILDVDYENGTLITFDIKYANNEWSAVFCKWNHNFRNFRIGGASSYFYLNEVLSVDIGDLITIPDGHGNWNPVTDMYKEAMLYYGIDEVNKKYVLVYTTKTEKVFNTLLIDIEDMTQTVVHKMILPNEASWTSNMNWNYFNSRFGYNSRPALFYNGKFAFPLYTVRTEHEQEISGVYMCLIDLQDSTNITALETHFIDTDGSETDWSADFPARTYQPLIKSGCGTAISSNWTVKNNVAYMKKENNQDWGFYYKGMMLRTKISGSGAVQISFQWVTCPYCLSISETLSKPFIKTLNKPIKYTFRIVNTGGNFYD